MAFREPADMSSSTFIPLRWVIIFGARAVKFTLGGQEDTNCEIVYGSTVYPELFLTIFDSFAFLEADLSLPWFVKTSCRHLTR